MIELKKSLTLVILVWLVTILAMNLMSQPLSSNARMSGLALSGASVMSDVDAIGVNPALIDMPRGTGFAFAILPFTTRAGTDFIDYESYVKYFTGVEGTNGRTAYTLSDQDKRSILNSFTDVDGTLYMDTRLQAFSAVVSLPALAVGVDMTDRVVSSVSIPRSLVEFLFYGNTPGKTFDLNTTKISSAWYRDYGLTIAKRFMLNQRMQSSISFGTTVKFIQGFAYFGVDRFNSRLTTDPDSFVITGQGDMHAQYAGADWLAEGNFSRFDLFPRPVGSGLGFDLGCQIRVSENFAIGMSVTDVGYIQWNRNAREVDASETFRLNDVTSDKQFDAILDAFNEHEVEVPSFTTELPSSVLLSGAYTIPRLFGAGQPMHVTFALREGLTSTLGNSTVPRVAAGAECNFTSWFALRLGTAVGGGYPLMLSGGISLIMTKMTLNLATVNLEEFFSRQFSHISVAVSTRFAF
jgi:hypothetical protein